MTPLLRFELVNYATSVETIWKDLRSWIFYFCYTANKHFISHCRKFWYSLLWVVYLRFASDSWEASLIMNSKKSYVERNVLHLQLLRLLQLQFARFVPSVFLKQVKESVGEQEYEMNKFSNINLRMQRPGVSVRSSDLQRMSDLHLHLLLGCTVTMANDSNDTSQLHPGGSRVGSTTFHYTFVSTF